MPDLEISVDDHGLADWLRSRPERINRALWLGATDATIYVEKQLRTYPTERSGSHYKRTGTLRRSWSRTVTGTGTDVVGRVSSSGNIAPYNREVQDQAWQARIHQDLWPTAQGVLRTMDDNGIAQGFFDTRINQALNER